MPIGRVNYSQPSRTLARNLACFRVLEMLYCLPDIRDWRLRICLRPCVAKVRSEGKEEVKEGRKRKPYPKKG